MLIRHVALVAETASINFSDLTKTAAALQKQATRDFGPIWNIVSTVNAFHSLDDVPSDYWPVIIRDDIKSSDAAGFHEDKSGQPFALVQYSEGWSLTASHETLEMLCDPFGNRIMAGQSPKRGQGRVNFLVEVSDPSEDDAFAYTVNGIVMSDFYTPHFFDPVTSSGVRYSFTGAIKKPLTVLKGGYLSWGVPETNEWFQETFFTGTKPKFRSLGVISAKTHGNLRAAIDRLTPTPLEQKALAQKKAVSYKPTVTSALTAMSVATTGRAAILRKEIAAIVGAK